MKTIKYILSIWAILSLSFFCFSCMDDEVSKSNQMWCDGKTLVLNLNAPATQVVSPMTKSAQKDTLMTDLNVLIYKDGQLTEGFYYDETSSPDLLAALQKGQEKQLDIILGKDAAGTVYAVANYGQDVYKELNRLGDDKSKFETALGLEKAIFPLVGGKQPKLYMYAKGGEFNVGSAAQNKIAMNLERIYSLVTVKIVKNLSQPQSGTFDVEPLSVQIKNIPTQGQFASRISGDETFRGNLIGVNGVGCEVDGEILSRTSENDRNFLEAEHGAAQAFYLYENRQPQGSSLNNNTDQTTKTPYGLPADEIISIIKQNRTCSYIEVQGKYIRNGNAEGVGSGEIIYRFFLGKDIYKDFDIERNTHYQVTLTLNGKGGADEATWRVETKLIGEIQAPDVYVGYRAGAKTRMYVTGDVDYVKSVTIATLSNPTNNGNQNQFTVSGTLQTDADGRYVEIEGLFTNVHDYAKRVGEVTFLLEGNGVQKEQRAKVYQVPRLVDPIAFYKKADNDAPVHIHVKEYDSDQRAYIDLASKGPWTATIKYSDGADNNWYKIYNTDEDGNEISGTAQSNKDAVISGDGPVQFGYKPLSMNMNVADARYGMILVRYHNNWCEHEIYLRQGYQPTQLGNQTWSLFNCTGLDSNGNPHVTVYPTQTGWLFKGGLNYGMHPFDPGFLQKSNDEKILYSDGQRIDFTRGDQSLTNALWENKQGPCPNGYIVADAYAYRTMVDASFAYPGYVHDDDPVNGWKYSSNDNGNAVHVTTDNSCNPAKGVLFIDKNNSTNLFFGYGKGIIAGIEKKDPKLVNEIGVGHRYRGVEYGAFGQMESNWGWLTVNDCNQDGNIRNDVTPAYGGWYWNSSSFGGRGGSHLGKVDFMYDLFSKAPFDIDVPNDQNDDGIHVKSNASFVRCVVSSTKTIDILAAFKFRKDDYIIAIGGLGLYRYVDFDNSVTGKIIESKNKLSINKNAKTVLITTGGGNIIGYAAVSDLIDSDKIIDLSTLPITDL